MKVIGFIDLDNSASVNDVSINKRYNGSRMHRFSVPFGITEKNALHLQGELGYHPAGYGFYSFDATISGTTWSCADSCD